jgi:FkbM family methyltransferase
MKLNLHDQIARSVYLYGIYDVAVTEAIRSRLRAGESFVDVGANIGTYSLMASRIVGPGGGVCAFEPCPQNFERLKENISLNGITNIRWSEKAISDDSSGANLYETPNPANSGQPSLKPRDGATKVKVLCTTLDKELRDSPVNLVKMDVEGCEDRVIRGGDRLFSRADAPLVLCEGDVSCLAAMMLEKPGYSITALPRRFYTPPNFLAEKR